MTKKYGPGGEGQVLKATTKKVVNFFEKKVAPRRENPGYAEASDNLYSPYNGRKKQNKQNNLTKS